MNEKDWMPEEIVAETIDEEKIIRLPSRLIREGSIGTCPECGSTEVKKYRIFGKMIGCISPRCEKYYKNRNDSLIDYIVCWSKGMILNVNFKKHKITLDIDEGEYYELHKTLSKKQRKIVNIPKTDTLLNYFTCTIFMVSGKVRVSLDGIPDIGKDRILPLYNLTIITDKDKICEVLTLDLRGTRL